VTVTLPRYAAHHPVVHVLQGQLRLGKEYNTFQALWRHWYYTAFCLGTLMWASFYMALVSLLKEWWRQRKWMGLEEPDCELDLDMDLGVEDEASEEYERPHANTASASAHTQPVQPTEPYVNDEQPSPDIPDEPHFEDWQERGRPSHLPRTSSHYVSETSESEWEDIFYSTHNG
jgi:hypothetical protein